MVFKWNPEGLDGKHTTSASLKNGDIVRPKPGKPRKERLKRDASHTTSKEGKPTVINAQVCVLPSTPCVKQLPPKGASVSVLIYSVGKYSILSRLFAYYSDVGRSTMVYGEIVWRTKNRCTVGLLVVCRIIGYWNTGALAYWHMITSWYPAE